MRLYIAEKPSLARALVAALPQNRQSAKQDGVIEVAGGDKVSWCIGHLLELAEPDTYDPAYKQWRLDHLPITPQQWQYQPKPKTQKQLRLLVKLIRAADEIVHVGDPDREGQLLVDEVITYAGKDPSANNVQRCLISDLNTPAVVKALTQLQPNQRFQPLSDSALARSRADWFYGINMTRLCSIKAQQQGAKGVVSVGRVQTPVLGLVVARDLEIQQFSTKPYFEVWAHLVTDKNECFKAKWQPNEACQDYVDEKQRLLSKPLAENIASRIKGQPATVTSYKAQNKKQAPPLPFSLSALQIEASKLFGLSAKQVLEICQALYEKHKLITYPRSDCRYLPNDHWQDAAKILQTLSSNIPELKNVLAAANAKQKSKAWNSQKVTAHHAIIPTLKKQSSGLSATEQKVYDLIARQYLMQFLPDVHYQEMQAEVKILTGTFIAKAKTLIDDGWQQASLKKDIKSTAPIPVLQVGQSLECTDSEITEKTTSPPKPYTDATLIAAMTGIARLVTDKTIKAILKETDGLGTEATRANIIDLLLQRGFITRSGKQINATDAGISLIQSLPQIATTPDMTAQWESQLSDIAEGRAEYLAFMKNLEGALPEVMAGVNLNGYKSYQKAGASKPKSTRRRRTGFKNKGPSKAKKA